MKNKRLALLFDIFGDPNKTKKLLVFLKQKVKKHRYIDKYDVYLFFPDYMYDSWSDCFHDDGIEVLSYEGITYCVYKNYSSEKTLEIIRMVSDAQEALDEAFSGEDGTKKGQWKSPSFIVSF